MKTLLVLLSAVVLFGGGFMYYKTTQHVTSARQVVATSTPSSYVSSDFTWEITNSAKYTETSPFQDVSLVVKGTKYPAGEHEGCQVVDSLETGQISKVICWWGGGGDEIAVYKTNDTYTLKTRWVQESGGPDVQAPPAGPWEIVSDIK